MLAPTLFGICFSLLLSYAFKDSTDGIYLHTRSDGNLFSLYRLKAKSKDRKVLIRELLFADDAAMATHTEEDPQRIIDSFSHACKEFGLTISIKKTNVMGQNVPTPPSITINNEKLEVTDYFTYLGSTICSNLSLDKEIDKRIAKAASVMTRLSKRVWSNCILTRNTKLKVYQSCVLSTLLYGSEAWTTYAKQENRLESFHLRCLRRILNIKWQDKITNTAVLEQAGSLSLHLLLCKRRLRWLGHVHRMQDGRIPKDIMYGELASGQRPTGRPVLRFKDVCKKDLKTANINVKSWDQVASDRCNWRQAVRDGVKLGEEHRIKELEQRRQQRKERQYSQTTLSSTFFVCSNCGRDCHARIGLLSHQRRCFSVDQH